jgi:hypothetical protein
MWVVSDALRGIAALSSILGTDVARHQMSWGLPPICRALFGANIQLSGEHYIDASTSQCTI